MSTSAAFWIPCALLLWAASLVFARDILSLHKSMDDIAKEMKASSKTV
jgi:uncharacterized protein Yka (UPF0111/DUF47 family)